MQLFFIVGFCVIAISVVVIVVVRVHLKNKSKELSAKLAQISPYSVISNYGKVRENTSALNEDLFLDIPADLSKTYYGKLISINQENDFVQHYQGSFQEAYSLLKKLKAFKITPSDTIIKFINDFRSINKFVNLHNEEVKALMSKYPHDLRSFQAIGYKEIIDGLDKGDDIETIKELIKKNSRNYAKRQYTYFNHQLEVNWFDSLKDAEEFGVGLFKKE